MGIRLFTAREDILQGQNLETFWQHLPAKATQTPQWLLWESHPDGLQHCHGGCLAQASGGRGETPPYPPTGPIPICWQQSRPCVLQRSGGAQGYQDETEPRPCPMSPRSDCCGCRHKEEFIPSSQEYHEGCSPSFHLCSKPGGLYDSCEHCKPHVAAPRQSCRGKREAHETS